MLHCTVHSWNLVWGLVAYKRIKHGNQTNVCIARSYLPASKKADDSETCTYPEELNKIFPTQLSIVNVRLESSSFGHDNWFTIVNLNGICKISSTNHSDTWEVDTSGKYMQQISSLHFWAHWSLSSCHTLNAKKSSHWLATRINPCNEWRHEEGVTKLIWKGM